MITLAIKIIGNSPYRFYLLVKRPNIYEKRKQMSDIHCTTLELLIHKTCTVVLFNTLSTIEECFRLYLWVQYIIERTHNNIVTIVLIIL